MLLSPDFFQVPSKTKKAVNNQFSYFFIDKESLEKELNRIILTLNSQTEFIDK